MWWSTSQLTKPRWIVAYKSTTKSPSLVWLTIYANDKWPEYYVVAVDNQLDLMIPKRWQRKTDNRNSRRQTQKVSDKFERNN